VGVRVLATGVAGSTGSHLAERSLADGHHLGRVDAFAPFCDVDTKQPDLADERHRRSTPRVEAAAT
jgi:hypothetical protein